MNEKEIKDNAREAICSLSGKPCRCSIGKGCGRGVVDPLADEALRYARTAAMRLDVAGTDLGFALESLRWERRFPATEWRDFGRRIEQLIDELQRTLK